jgi:hypothetical protein
MNKWGILFGKSDRINELILRLLGIKNYNTEIVPCVVKIG